MGNKQFKVMVVPRWFTITPETVKALAYVYDYHVRDMPAFFNPSVVNINEALLAKYRLEGIISRHSPGYFAGWVNALNSDNDQSYSWCQQCVKEKGIGINQITDS